MCFSFLPLEQLDVYIKIHYTYMKIAYCLQNFEIWKDFVKISDLAPTVERKIYRAKAQ
jgi:hypothetical protein